MPRRRLAHPHIIAYYDAFFEADCDLIRALPGLDRSETGTVESSVVILGAGIHHFPIVLLLQKFMAQADQLHIVLEYADGGPCLFLKARTDNCTKCGIFIDAKMFKDSNVVPRPMVSAGDLFTAVKRQWIWRTLA